MQSLFTKYLKFHKQINSKNLWAYVAIAFNRVDLERLKLVGPNRLCAEWILKNGGAVAFSTSPGKFLKDYNALPPDNIQLLLKEVDASNSSIMKIGLEHFKNCKHINTVIFDTCKHLEDDSLEGLIHIKDTLQFLHLSNCSNFSNETFEPVKNLRNLVKLKITNFDQIEVKQIANELKTHLPNCEVTTE